MFDVLTKKNMVENKTASGCSPAETPRDVGIQKDEIIAQHEVLWNNQQKWKRWFAI